MRPDAGDEPNYTFNFSDEYEEDEESAAEVIRNKTLQVLVRLILNEEQRNYLVKNISDKTVSELVDDLRGLY